MGLFKRKDKQQPANNSQGEKSVGDIVDEAVNTALSKYAKKDKRKNKKSSDDKLYITPEDISQLRDKYQPLFQQLREDEECSDTYVNAMCDTILSAMQTEIGDISLCNKLDHELMLAQIEARNKKQIPAYTHPLRRLFLKTPNRAMAIILDEAELSADEIHFTSEHENDVSAFKIEKVKAELIATDDIAKNAKGKKMSRRRLKKLRRKYDELSELFAPLQTEESEEKVQEPEQAPTEEVPEEAPAEQLPVRKKRKKKTSDESEQLPGQNEIDKVESNNDSEPSAPLQPEEGEQRVQEPEQAPTEEVPEETLAEQLPVRKKRKKKTSDESEQLPGQIEIDKVENNDDSEQSAPLQPKEGEQQAQEPEQVPTEEVPEEAPAEQLPIRKKHKKKTSDESEQLLGQIEIEENLDEEVRDNNI